MLGSILLNTKDTLMPHKKTRFEFIRHAYNGTGTEVRTSITICEESTIGQVAEAFEDFLRAAGFSDKTVNEYYSRGPN